MNLNINTSAPTALTATGVLHARVTLRRLLEALAVRASCRGCGIVGEIEMALARYVNDNSDRDELMARLSEHPVLKNLAEMLRAADDLIDENSPAARPIMAMVYAELQRLAPLW